MHALRPQQQPQRLQLGRRQPQHSRLRPYRAAAAAAVADGAAAAAAANGASSKAPWRRPRPNRLRLCRAAAAVADDGAAAANGSSSKAHWWEKNVEGWASLETASDLARAAHAARQSNRRVLALDLYAPSCSVCKSSWPALSRLARDDALVRDVFFAKASIDEPEIRRILKEQGITGIPWVLVLDVGETDPEPPSEGGEAADLLKGLAATFLKKQLGAGGGAEAAAPEQQQQRVLESAGATVVLGQGASFKKIAVLRSNLTAVPALVKRGQKVVVDPNGLVVVA